MKVLVGFCIDADIIECPEDVTNEINNYQQEFFKWLFNEDNDHSYWMYDNGQKSGCNYRSDAFVEWLNTYVYNKSDEKAKVIETGVEAINNGMLEIGF